MKVQNKIKNMSNNNSSGGIGFAGLLTIVFVVLRLCKVITWSWWWVLSPLWISTGLFIVVGLIVYLTYKGAQNTQKKLRR